MKKRFLLTMLAIFTVMAMIPFTALTAQATTGEFDGEWVTLPANVASVTTAGGTTTNYTALSDAFAAAAAAENSELKLLTTVEMSNYIKVTSGKFTLNLNGQTWKSSSHVLWIGGTADIRITDTAGGALNGTSDGYPTIQLDGSAKLEIAGGMVENTNGSNAIVMWYGGQKTSSELTISGGTVKSNATDTSIAINAYGNAVTVTGGTIEGAIFDIEYANGIIDLSGHPDPAGITVANFTGTSVTVGGENFKIPAGYVMVDSNGNAQTTLSNNKTYIAAADSSSAAPAAPNVNNVRSEAIYVFACNTKLPHGQFHQTTGIAYDVNYFEAGEPVKNADGKWIAEVTCNVKAMWENSTMRIYEVNYPDYAHPPHDELPEALTITLTWDAELEMWVYDNDFVTYDISCEVPTYTVTVNSATNGTVTASSSAAAEGETVTLTVTPAEGYELDTLTVTDANSTPVTVTNDQFAMPALNVTVSATFKPSGGSGEGTNYADYNCKKCGKPCDGWFTLSSSEGKDIHVPFCSVCYIMQNDGAAVCTPAEGTATCINAVRCSVCNFAMTTTHSPDPNAHNWSDWKYESSDQHSKYCKNLCGLAIQLEDHSGGDGSCKPTCEDCGQLYQNPNGEHTNMCDWYALDNDQHTRTCIDCGGNQEYADHTDENKDHNCDICSKELTKCADENKDHKCDVCSKELTKCADENKDHKCDVCTNALGECADADKNGKCDVCGNNMPAEHNVTVPDTDAPDTDKVVTTAKDEEPSDDDPTAIIITVAVVAVIAIGGAVAFVIIRKKK